MSSPYQGADTFPDTLTLPDDGDDLTALSVNTPLEALGDNVKYLLRRAQTIAALNWLAAVTTTHNLKRGAWSALEQTWYGVGDGGLDFLERSQDSGRTWANLTSALGASKVVQDVAVAANGNLVLVNAGSRNIYFGTYTGYGCFSTGGSWADVSNALAAAPTTVRVARDETAGLFCALYRTGATGFKTDHGNSGAAFAAGSLPASWTGYTGSHDAEIGAKVGGGRLVAAYIDDAGGGKTVRPIYSTDGGVTWTASTTFLPTMSAPTIVSRPTHNAERDEWYLLISKTGGAATAELWRSTDGGVNFSKVGGFTAEAHSIACFDDRLVCILSDGREVYSVDRGVTWKLGNKSPQTSAVFYEVRDGGGGFMFWNSGDKTSFATTRSGDVGSTIT